MGLMAKALTIGGLAILLLAAVTPSLAVNQYTATYLLELYFNARSDLVSLLDFYLSAGVSVNTESTSEANETATGSTTITTNASTSIAGSGVLVSTHHPWCTNIGEMVNSTIQLADQYVSAANVSLQSGNYVLASRQALKALNLVGKAYVKLSMCLSDEGLLEYGQEEGGSGANVSVVTGANASVEMNVSHGFNTTNPHAGHPAIGLVSAVLRHEVRLSRLKAALKTAEESGVNVSEGWDLVGEVEDLLAKARELALEGNSSAAAQLLREANEAMSVLVRYLRTSSAVALEHRSEGHWHHFNASSGWGRHVNFTGNATVTVTGRGGEHGHGHGGEDAGMGEGEHGPWNADWTAPGPGQGRDHGWGHGNGHGESEDGGRSHHSNIRGWSWGSDGEQEGGEEGGS